MVASITRVSEEANSEEVILVEQRDRVLIITINRPKARNAVNAAVSRGLADAMDRLDAEDGLSVGILTGAGGSFSAGMDLKAFARGENVVVEGRGMGFTERPPSKPLIAAVEGYCLAGGCELALATDLIVASKESAFGIPEVKRGLVAGGGGLLRLPQRMTTIVWALGALALALAAVGLAGLVVLTVSQRAREIGIRMALGARPRDVIDGVLRQFRKPIAYGLAGGLFAAAVLSRVLEKELFGLSPFDPVSYLTAAALFTIVAALATAGPLRRALKVDPISALKCE